MTAAPQFPKAPPSESPRLRWAGIGLLIALCIYLSVVLGLGIARTEHLEQDSANYVEVTQRWLDGEGFTSLSDRRGPANPVDFPQPFRAANQWPLVLGAVAWLTGDVAMTGMLLSLFGVIAALVLGSWCVRRGVLGGVLGGDDRVPWLFCVLAVAAAVSHKRTVSNAILPMTDGLSLFLNVAVIASLVTRRHVLAVLLVALACLVRYQNCALVFPLVYGLAAHRPRLRALTLGFGVLAGLWFVGQHLFEGLWAFINPGDRESLVRTVRWLAPPMLVGLWMMRKGSGLQVFLWLGAGHLLVILSNYDASDGHHWLFGIRHGWPLHFVAAALGAFAVARTKTWLRFVLFACLCVATVDNVRTPWRIMQERSERTGLGSLKPMLVSLKAQPLAEGSIILCYQADILAAELKVPAVHLRGWNPEDLTFVDCVRRQYLTHVLLTWSPKRVMARSNAWMTGMEDALGPHMRVERSFVLEDGVSRAVLLAWKE